MKRYFQSQDFFQILGIKMSKRLRETGNWELNDAGEWEISSINSEPFKHEYVFLDGSLVPLSIRSKSHYNIYIAYLKLEGWEITERKILREKTPKCRWHKANNIMVRKEVKIGKSFKDDGLVCFDGVKPAEIEWGKPQRKYLSIAKDSHIRINGENIIDMFDKRFQTPIIVENVFREKPSWIDKVAYVKFGKTTPFFKAVYSGIDLAEGINSLAGYCKNSYAPGYPLPFYGVHVLASQNLERKIYEMADKPSKVKSETKREGWLKTFRG